MKWVSWRACPAISAQNLVMMKCIHTPCVGTSGILMKAMNYLKRFGRIHGHQHLLTKFITPTQLEQRATEHALAYGIGGGLGLGERFAFVRADIHLGCA